MQIDLLLRGRSQDFILTEAKAGPYPEFQKREGAQAQWLSEEAVPSSCLSVVKGRRQFATGGGTNYGKGHMASAERKPIMGVWGQSP